MPLDDDDADDRPLGAPLPRDDRLWRHPSEMSTEGEKQQIVLVTKGGLSLGRTLLVTLLAGLVGASVTLAVVAGTDVFVREKKGDTSVERQEVPPPESPGRNELAIADKVLPAVARVEATGPGGVVNGTAVVFRSDGHLITTADLVDASTVVVYLNDGAKLDAKVVGRSPDADISILKVERTDLPVAVGTKRTVSFGDLTVMIDASNPNRGPDIKLGVVTKESTEVAREDKSPVYGLIQATTRASVTPRSPGSVLVDTGGTVIGFITSRAEPPVVIGSTTTTVPIKAVTNASVREPVADEGNALHFATPADFAWDIAGQLVDKGSVVKPWMGLRGVDMSREEAARDNATEGMRITFVEDASPTAKARLRVDDIVVSLEDDTVRSYNDFVVALRRHKPGEQIKISYIRNGEFQNAITVVGAKPEQP